MSLKTEQLFSFWVSRLGGMSEKNTAWSPEKADLILPFDFKAIWLTSEESMKAVRKKMAL